MNVSFKLGEMINGFKVKTINGLSEFVFENDEVIICFRSDAGEGINYSNVQWYTDKRTNKQYRAMRYHLKYVRMVQEFSNVLYQRYNDSNKKVETKCGHYDKYPVPFYKEVRNPKTGRLEASDEIDFYVCNECYTSCVFHRR